MKILAVTDQVVDSIYSEEVRHLFGDVDLVVSCGDLPYSYLEFIASMLNVPCFFVRGNHDAPEYLADGRTLYEPGGWVNLDGRTVRAEGTILAGLEGSKRYKPRGRYQYTDRQMVAKIWLMMPRLLMNRVRFGRYLDILVTHASPRGIHDGQDVCHSGFEALLTFLVRFRPHYLLHGHTHVYAKEATQTRFRDTEVINVYPFRVIEW